MTNLSVIEIQTIHPTERPLDSNPSDEDWFNRRTVRTFKVATVDQSQLNIVASQALAAYLSTHPGTLGSYTTYTWYPEGTHHAGF